MLYESESAGRREIFVRDLVTGREIQVSNSGGMEPAWSRDRDEVFFRDTSDYWLKSARITRDPELRVSDQEALFTTTPYWMGLIETAYDTAAGGKFLMVRQRDPGASPDRIQVILNFTDRLSR